MDLCCANSAADLLDKQTFTKAINRVELPFFLVSYTLPEFSSQETKMQLACLPSMGLGEIFFE